MEEEREDELSSVPPRRLHPSGQERCIVGVRRLLVPFMPADVFYGVSKYGLYRGQTSAQRGKRAWRSSTATRSWCLTPNLHANSNKTAPSASFS